MDHPRRFRGDPQRTARIARPLRLVARIRETDEDLLDLVGRRMFARDEAGAELVRAMRADQGAGRVTMAQIELALAAGIDAVPEAPPALVRFFALVDAVPEWVDFDLIERGAAVLRRSGRVASDVLLPLSLIGGYRFAGPVDLLAATGGLAGPTAMRRLGETEAWRSALNVPGGLRRGGAGFRLTVHVRVMHALVNDRFERNGRWDIESLGLPVNRSDTAATLGLFNSTMLLGMRVLGWRVSAADSRAVMHLWKYVGQLLGVDEDWLFDSERAQHVFNFHVLMAQGRPTPAGARLSPALVDGRHRLDRERLSPVRTAYERARLLGLLRTFLGRRGLGDLGLPVGLPWMLPLVQLKNLGLSILVARTGHGRRLLERVGERHEQERLQMFFEGARHQIAPLPEPDGPRPGP